MKHHILNGQEAFWTCGLKMGHKWICPLCPPSSHPPSLPPLIKTSDTSGIWFVKELLYISEIYYRYMTSQTQSNVTSWKDFIQSSDPNNYKQLTVFFDPPVYEEPLTIQTLHTVAPFTMLYHKSSNIASDALVTSFSSRISLTLSRVWKGKVRKPSSFFLLTAAPHPSVSLLALLRTLLCISEPSSNWHSL